MSDTPNAQPSGRSLTEAVRRLNEAFDFDGRNQTWDRHHEATRELARALDEIKQLQKDLDQANISLNHRHEKVVCGSPFITEETLLKEARGFNPEEYGRWLDVTEAALRRGIELAGGKIAEPVDPLVEALSESDPEPDDEWDYSYQAEKLREALAKHGGRIVFEGEG